MKCDIKNTDVPIVKFLHVNQLLYQIGSISIVIVNHTQPLQHANDTSCGQYILTHILKQLNCHSSSAIFSTMHPFDNEKS